MVDSLTISHGRLEADLFCDPLCLLIQSVSQPVYHTQNFNLTSSQKTYLKGYLSLHPGLFCLRGVLRRRL